MGSAVGTAVGVAVGMKHSVGAEVGRAVGTAVTPLLGAAVGASSAEVGASVGSPPTQSSVTGTITELMAGMSMPSMSTSGMRLSYAAGSGRQGARVGRSLQRNAACAHPVGLRQLQ